MRATIGLGTTRACIEVNSYLTNRRRNCYTHCLKHLATSALAFAANCQLFAVIINCGLLKGSEILLNVSPLKTVVGVVTQSQNVDEHCWVRISYYITLYSPDGGSIALFRVDAVGESRPGDSIGAKSFGEAMHFAMRDAAAQVMTGFSDEPAVREWLQALGIVSSVISPRWSERLSATGQE